MKEVVIKFYINKFVYVNEIDNIDVSFVPSILKRRMNIIDKAVFSVLHSVLSDDIEEIFFSSQFGEVERLFKIIEQYSEQNEVSPNTFSGSVHNYPVGLYLLNEQKAVPYTALANGEKSISSGLLAAVTSRFNRVVYVYADVFNGKINAFAVDLCKCKLPNSAECEITLKGNSEKDDSYNDFVRFFDGDSDYLNTEVYNLERICQ